MGILRPWGRRWQRIYSLRTRERCTTSTVIMTIRSTSCSGAKEPCDRILTVRSHRMKSSCVCLASYVIRGRDKRERNVLNQVGRRDFLNDLYFYCFYKFLNGVFFMTANALTYFSSRDIGHVFSLLMPQIT